MKKILLPLFSVFVSMVTSAQVLQVQTVNKIASFEAPIKRALVSQNKSIGACAADTIDYAITKASAVSILSVNNVTSGQAVSQYFNAPQDITLHGTSFYAFKEDLNGGPTTTIEVDVYLAGADSMPTGSSIATQTLSIDTTFGGGVISAFEQHVTFSTPVTVSQPYVIVVSNPSPNSIGVVANSFSSADGIQEWLSSVNIGGTWTRSYSVSLGGDLLDADFLIAPHVTYDLTVDFSATPTSFSSATNVSFTDASSPVLYDRMYNRAAYFGFANLSFTYDFGDASAIEKAFNPSHNYTTAQQYTVTLSDTIFGWRRDCFGTETLELNAPGSNLVITEIMYNGPESGLDSSEFIEIFNNGATDVDLTGFQFIQGVVYTFPNVTLLAGDYYVIAVNSSAFFNTYGVTEDDVFTGGLSNGGEDIVLVNASGVTLDSVDYNDGAPWPTGTSQGGVRGGGASLVLCDVNSDNNIGSNWSASTTSVGVTVNGFQVLASPGMGNGCCTAVTGTDNSTICNDESLVINGTTYDASNPTGTEVFVGGSSSGCDSTVTVSLTVLAAITGSETSTICATQSIVVNGTVYDASNSTGTEVFANGSASGCDSTVTVNLNVLSPVTGSETSTICSNGSLMVNGTLYDASNSTGTEVFANAGANGCDSIVTINLNVLPAVDVTTSQSGLDLSANASGLVYQWVDCDNGNAVINNETNQSFTAVSNGNYAVIVTENSCLDTSICIVVNTVGFDEVTELTGVQVYPNPAVGSFNVALDQLDNNESSISIYNTIGALVYSKVLVGQLTTIATDNLSKGVYLLQINNKDTKQVVRLVVE